jgi:DNA-binding CsgD family transcriptional regulator/tetratricopeptide (TPR) repeat protein
MPRPTHPMPFVDRDTQVDALLGYAAEADAGTGRLVLVEGEAGVGKSTLLEQVERRLPEATWHWGACDGLFTPLPLAPLRDIAEGVGGDLLDACHSDASRETLFTALMDAVRGNDALTVLVFEDVHWADEATLDLLRHTGRRIQRERALLLVSFRDDESGARTASGTAGTSAPLRQALGELSRQRATRRVTLPPLSRTGIERLVAGTGLDAAEVHTLTGGNPYFVAEVIRGGGARLPASARDAVLARVAPLDQAARDLLDAAALAGNRVDPTLLEEVVDSPRTAYDMLLGAGLLVSDSHGLRFRHEIARLAVADAVPEPRRTALHSRVLAALLGRGDDDDARLAFHANGAGDVAAVLRHSRAAARRAASLAAHREAVLHYRRALAATEGEGDDPRTRAEILDALATELGLIDEWAEADRRWDEALALWRELGDGLREGDALRSKARGLTWLARGEEARETVQQALAVLEPLGPTSELARTLKQLSAAAMMRGEHRSALEYADRAAALAEQLDLPDVLSDVLDTRACSMLALGQDWVPVMQRALDVGVAAGCHEQVGRAYSNHYAGLISTGRAADGEGLFLDAQKYCEDHEVASYGNCILATRIEALEFSGRWPEAMGIARSHLQTVTLSPNNWMHFALSLGRIGLRRGDEGADADIDGGLEAAEGVGEPQWVVPFRLLVAERHWVAGRRDQAATAVSSALDAAAAVPADGLITGPSHVWARRLGVPAPEPEAVGELWVAELRGDVAGAVARWDAVGAPYEAALALAFSSSTADRVEAVRRLDALGALPVAARVRKSLREAGVRSLPGVARATTRDHPAGLTTREQEVLELLGEGLTNEEIADRLVISVKTAGHHVSAVLAKLGVSGRRDAVAEAARLGLLPARRAASVDGVDSLAR